MASEAGNLSFGNFIESHNNITDQDNQPREILLIVIGVTHFIIVVLPCLILGTIVLYLMISKEKKATLSAISIIFIFITSVCTIAPLTYGLLMDLSLIIDVPLIGGCNTPFFWTLFTFFHFLLSFSTTTLSVLQYGVIRWGKKKWNRIIVIVLMVLVPICLAISFSSFIRLHHLNSTIRGSLCQGRLTLIVIIRIAVYFSLSIPPAVVTVILFSYLSYRYVKRNIVHTENKNRARNVVKFLVLSNAVAVIFRLLPSLTSLLTSGSSGVDDVIGFLLTYSLDTNYTLYIIFIISIHKSLRESLKMKIKSLIPKRIFNVTKTNQVTPQSSNTKKIIL